MMSAVVGGDFGDNEILRCGGRSGGDESGRTGGLLGFRMTPSSMISILASG